MMRPTHCITILLCLLQLTAFLCPVAGAAALSAKAVVEKTDVFQGEPFIFQIQVSGSEDPEQPDLSHVTDFVVTYGGGQQNSSRSVTIINGKVTQDVRQGYFFSYRLTPKKTGKLVIPSITVTGDGQTARTTSVMINVRKPVETDDFKLRLNLSKDDCYVGEPVTLTVTWYIGKDVKDFSFTIPLLNDDAFHIASPEVDMQSTKKRYRIPLGGDEAIGEKGQGRIDDRDFATISFKKILIPKQAGNISIKPATVTCNALVGYEQRRGRSGNDFFSDFFNDDFFGRSQRGVYKNVVVPSNELALRVSELPSDHRPDNFAGHVGEYGIQSSAAPTEVSVGDPITLTITLTGPDYLEHVNLPALNSQKIFSKNFKIPKERATGEVKGKSKIFTQTIRALREDVTEIPAIELPYFDTKKSAYAVARTKPIPLNVKKTRVVTAMDAEGIETVGSSASELETWSKGIAFNYEDMGVIENEYLGLFSWFKTPFIAGMTLIPPVVFFLSLTGLVVMRQRKADPAKARARKAYTRLTNSIKDAQKAANAQQRCNKILDALRSYLADKLGLTRGALTFMDVKDSLASNGIDGDLLQRLKEFFDKCEAGRYAGTVDISDTATIGEQAVYLAKDLEKKLK